LWRVKEKNKYGTRFQTSTNSSAATGTNTVAPADSGSEATGIARCRTGRPYTCGTSGKSGSGRRKGRYGK